MTAAAVIRHVEEPMLAERPMIVEQLAEVSAARAKLDTKAVREAVAEAREALDLYEQSAIERAERRLTRVMLEAIGHTGELTSTVPAEHEAVETVRLLGAVGALTALLAAPSATTLPSEAPSVKDEAPVHVAPPLVLKPERAATAEEIERIEKLFVEVCELEGHWKGQPRERLTHQLKAIAAEVRQLILVFPHAHTKRWDLEKLPSKLHCVVRDASMEFINGIGSTSTGDWNAIAQRERRAVMLFDRRVSNPVVPKKNSGGGGMAKLGDVLGPKLLRVVKPEPAEPASTAGDANASRWIQLRALLHGKKLMVVGGLAEGERSRTLEKRTGMTVEWGTIDKHSPRQVESLVRRIEGGSVVACLIAEGIMSHKDYNRIDAACRRADILSAFCGRAGSAQIDEALDTLERRLRDE